MYIGKKPQIISMTYKIYVKRCLYTTHINHFFSIIIIQLTHIIITAIFYLILFVQITKSSFN